MGDFDRRRELEHDFLRMVLPGTCQGVVDVRDVLAICPVDHVTERVPRAIYAALRDTTLAGIPPTLDAVYRTLRDANKADTTKGESADYIADVSADTLSAYTFSIFSGREEVILRTAQKVRDEYAKRQAETQLTALVGECKRYDTEATDIAHALAELSQGMEGSFAATPPDLGELMGRVLAAAENGNSATPMPTPWRNLNAVLKGGLAPGELAVLAARPGMGKTALAGCIAVEAARSGRQVLFISREVKDIALGYRFCAREGRVDVSIFRQHADRAPELLPAIREAAVKLAALPLRVVEKSIAPMTPMEVRRLARGIKGRGGEGVGLVVVDYLQLLNPDTKSNSREREVAEMSRSMKQLALDCNCPVLLLSQLNRSGEEADRAPRLSDLRESGAIEQDADIVLFLHAPKSSRSLVKMPVSAIVAKGRSSGTGTAHLTFNKPFSDFAEDIATDNWEATKANMAAAAAEELPDF